MKNNWSLDLAAVPKELRVILKWLTTNDSPELLDLDWDLFIKQARHHRVFPLLYTKIKDHQAGEVPTWVMDTLCRDYQRNTFQMLHLSAEMERVGQLFADDKIKALFLKGPVLAKDLYGDISLRTSSDLDILIPIDQLEQAEHHLKKLGYLKNDYIETVLNDWRWRHHHLTYFHPQKKIKLEIHWRLNPGPAKEPNFDALWERKRLSDLTSYPVYLLGREDLFLFLISHGARHGWSRLRWLVDIKYLIQSEIDWNKAIHLLKKYGYQHVAGQGIVLVTKLFGFKVTKKTHPLLRGRRPRQLAQQAIFYLEAMINLHTDPVPDRVARYHKRHLFSLMSFRQKVLFILSFLYPYPEDVETLPLPRKLHFLYFPLRPALWAWRKTRKHALS